MAVSVIPRHLIQAELQDGIAQLKNGLIQFSDELSVGSLLGGGIESWIPFNQPVHTTICIVGPHEWRYIDIAIERRITKSLDGKIIAANIDEIYPLLDQRLQRLIFSTSKTDQSFAEFFAKNQLMNDEDINTFKSKLLSIIEADVIPGIEYGFETSSIIINKDSVRRVDRKFGSGSDDSFTLSGDDDLDINHLFQPGELDAILSTNKTE